MLFQCSGVSSRKPRLAPKPAFAKDTSIWPNPARTVEAMRSWSSHSVTSQRTTSARSGPPSSSASAFSFSSRRAASTSRYPASPARRAVASPIPLEAPVMRKTGSATPGRLAAADVQEQLQIVLRLMEVLPETEAELLHHLSRGGVLGGAEAYDTLETELVERVPEAGRARFGGQAASLPRSVDEPANLRIARPEAMVSEPDAADELSARLLLG